MRLQEHRDKLGPPALKLAGLELWIHGRQFPDTTEPWDADWLRITAFCAAPGARVWVEGPILGSSSLANWAGECELLHTTLTGQAELHSYEPNIRLLLEMGERTGSVVLSVFLTPDHVTQEHRFEFAIDQSYLPQLLDDLRAILHVYPVPAAIRAR